MLNQSLYTLYNHLTEEDQEPEPRDNDWPGYKYEKLGAMLPKRTCENCANHISLHDMAVCEYTDRGIFKTSICKHWTGKKYSRTQEKHRADFELKIAEREGVY